MRRKILKWQHVASGQRNHRFGIAGARQLAEALQYGNEILDPAIVIDHNDQRTVCISPQKYQQQRFCRWGEPRNTNAPRALPQMGGNTREGGKHFYVREEFPDEGKKHANSILTGTSVRSFDYPGAITVEAAPSVAVYDGWVFVLVSRKIMFLDGVSATSPRNRLHSTQ